MDIKIFTAIFLIAVVAEIHCASTGYSPEEDVCQERYNINGIKVTDSGNLTEEEKRKISCYAGCVVKDASLKDKKTMHEYVLDLINKGSLGLTNGDPLKQKLNNCANVGDDECKFMQCLDLFSRGKL